MTTLKPARGREQTIMGESKRRKKQDPNYEKVPLLTDIGMLARQSERNEVLELFATVQPDASKVQLVKGLNPNFPDWAFARIDYQQTSTLGVKGIFHVLLPTEGNFTDAQYHQIIDDIRFGRESLVLASDWAVFKPKSGYRLLGKIHPFLLASAHTELSDFLEQTKEDRLKLADELVKCNS